MSQPRVYCSRAAQSCALTDKGEKRKTVGQRLSIYLHVQPAWNVASKSSFYLVGAPVIPLLTYLLNFLLLSVASVNLVPPLWTGVPTPSAPADRQDPLPIFRPRQCFHAELGLRRLSGACPLAKLQDSRAPRARRQPCRRSVRAQRRQKDAPPQQMLRTVLRHCQGPLRLCSLLLYLPALIGAVEPGLAWSSTEFARSQGVPASPPRILCVCVLLTACHRGALQLENIAGLAQR